jgi:hypothetical protein
MSEELVPVLKMGFSECDTVIGGFAVEKEAEKAWIEAGHFAVRFEECAKAAAAHGAKEARALIEADDRYGETLSSNEWT